MVKQPMYTDEIMSYFPLENPRPGQVAVIREIDKLFKLGKKLIILEGPVGCGKSAIALTFAKAFANSHIITPRKSLQNQYYNDFSNDLVTMKGRGSYPCTYGASPSYNQKIIKLVESGKVEQPLKGEPDCSHSPCKGSRDVYLSCTQATGPCPYQVAIETAQSSSIVTHNLHSFIFQTAFTEKFDKRQLLVIDEAHTVENVVRDFLSRKLVVGVPIKDDLTPDNSLNIDSWCDFFLKPQFLPKLSVGEAQMVEHDPEYISPIDAYKTKVENLRFQKEYYSDKFCVKREILKVGDKEISTSFEFITDSLGNAPSKLLFEFGEHVILMSGTIYSKEVFCSNLGIDPASAHYIRLPSTFPAKNRPIYMKPDYQVDTSFACWNDNFDEMVEKIDKILSIFHDAKGLIHCPSYTAAEQIALALRSPRVVCHQPNDFQYRLEEFFERQDNSVFLSPVCAEGVDFKQDRARFQIILRVPYLNTSDPFVKYKVERDFPWYNYNSLVTFGQQLGRINRSEDDYGCTFLMDSRFNKYLSRNKGVIPKWVMQGVVTK